MSVSEEYYLETHKVTTEDGYILSLYRVRKTQLSNGENDGTSKEMCTQTRPQVLIVHGMVCSGTEWLINSPEKALPCILLEQGYDCWLGSLRGSKLSKGHTSLSFRSKKFWDYSVHEPGCFDIPAIIDFILKETRQKELYYIGHSLGCSVFFIAMIMRPEYKPKVKAMIAMCPAVYGLHVQLVFLKFAGWITALIGKRKCVYRRKMPIKTGDSYSKYICLPKAQSDKFIVWLGKCVGKMVGAVSSESEQITKDDYIKLYKTAPASTSCKLYAHVMQVYKSGIPQAFDHGRSGNLKKYGQTTPPVYDIKTVDVPIATFTSNLDELVPSKDVARVAAELPNLISHTEITDPAMSHADFMVGKDTHKIVYEPIIQIFRQFSEIELAEI